LESLADFDDVAVAELLLGVWPRLSPQLRAQVTEALLSRNTWLAVFLDAIETKKVARGDVDPARVSLLKKHPDKQVRERVEQLFQASPSRRADVIQDYQQALQLTGDPARGKQVFKEACSACHKLAEVGTAVGAELTAIRDRGPSVLLLNILDPNREVKPKFLSYVSQTDDGRVLTGMIIAESANGLTLRRPDGSEVTVQRTEIEELRSTGLSFMPEGLEKNVDHQAMADLLEYLRIAR
jgi:putative heme-binding domain-containing protein